MRLGHGSVLIALCLFATVSAQAANPDVTGCESERVPSQQIEYCTRVIQSGLYSGVDAAWVYRNRASAHLIEQNYDQAIADYDKAIRLKPDYPGALVDRGQAYAGKRQYDRAVADYDAAIRLKPGYPEAFNVRGNARVNQGHLEQGIADYDAALKLRPDYAEALINRGTAYSDLGQLDRAMADYDAAIR